MACAVNDVDVYALGATAVPSAVAISNVTPLAPAGVERLTVKLNVVVPLSPSFNATSLMVRLGAAAPACGVIEKSSIARPSSAPDGSISVQRIQNVAPFGIFKLLIELERAVR